MGFKDRIQGIRQYMSSPYSVSMAELGSDKVVTAGQAARVVVQVEGEDDGTAQGIDLRLRYSGGTEHGGYDFTDLAAVPMEAGVHELTVVMPVGLAPSVASVNEYCFVANVRRSKGVEADALSAVDVIARPEDLWWPKGPRASQASGAEAVAIDIAVDAETVDLGGTLRGTVTLRAVTPPSKLDVTLIVGATVTSAAGPQNKVSSKFKAFADASLAKGTAVSAGEQLVLPFSITVPADQAPTVYSSEVRSIIWELRVEAGKATASRLIGVLDPTAEAGNRNNPQRAASWLLVDGY